MTTHISYKNFSKVLVVFLLFIMFCGAFITPYRSGDGQEYMLMVQAFENHFSPDLRTTDLITASQDYNYNFSFADYSEAHCFFANDSGKVYSYHFWFYSLLVLPFKLILKALNANQLGAFYFCNATLMFFMFLFSYLLIEDKKKCFFWILLTGFNPIIFYITWTHAEVFTYVFTCISLIAFLRKKYKTAILLVSIAGMQNQPIIFLGGFYWLIQAYENSTNDFRKNGKVNLYTLFKSAICFTPFFIPLCFYYINFGTISLIASNSSSIGIDFTKILSLFFDLNLGMILWIPIVLLLFCFLLPFNFKNNKRTILYLFTLFAICFICSWQRNWNPGMSGINRYSVWITPILIYYILFECPDSLWSHLTYKITLFASAVLTTVLIFNNGGFVCSQSYTTFTPVSMWFMKNHPALYNPQQEIFRERYMGKETSVSPDFFPMIILNDQDIRKIFVNNGNFNYLENIISENDMIYVTSKKKDTTDWYYINIPKNTVSLKTDCVTQNNRIYIAPTKCTYEITDIKIPSELHTNNICDITFTFKNTSTWQYYSQHGLLPLGISFHILSKSNSMVRKENERAYLNNNLYPGEEATITLSLDLREIPEGTYKIAFDCVFENFFWFSDFNKTTNFFEITVID